MSPGDFSLIIEASGERDALAQPRLSHSKHVSVGENLQYLAKDTFCC